jgi:hypothetical protein
MPDTVNFASGGSTTPVEQDASRPGMPRGVGRTLVAITADPTTIVYKDSNLSELLEWTLPTDTEIEMSYPADGAPSMIRFKDRSGYVRPDAKVRVLSGIFLPNPDGTTVHEQPASSSVILGAFRRGDEIVILETVKTPKGDWVKIRDIDGAIGYMNGNTKVLFVANLRESIATQKADWATHNGLLKYLTKLGLRPAVAEEFLANMEQEIEEYSKTPHGQKKLNSQSNGQMLLGIALMAGGIIASVWSYNTAASGSGGGRYFVFYGAVIWGLYYLIKGFFGSPAK